MDFQRIAEMIASHTDIDVKEITPETTFEALHIDSLDTVEMVMQLEEELGVELELDKKLLTVGDLLQFLQEKLGQNQ